MRQNYPVQSDIINGMEDLLAEACCTTSETIRISGDDKPAEVVKSRFMKLDSSYLQYVMENLNKNAMEVHNIKQYLLVTLYNAPMTIDSYYNAQVWYDFGPL